MNKQKLKLAGIIFMPIIFVLIMVSGAISYFYSSDIENLNHLILEQAQEFSFENDEDIFPEIESIDIDAIISEDDWEYLSAAEIDTKLINNELPPIGDINDPFYNTPNNKINDQLFLIDAEIIEDSTYALADSVNFSTLKNASYLNVDDLENIENTLNEKNLKSLIWILALGGLFAGLIAWWLAIKSLKPLELSLQKQKEFVANVSHELKTPLAMMKTEAEVLLKNKSEINEYKTFTKNTIIDIDTMNEMANKLLNLTKINTAQKAQEAIDIKNSWNRLSKKFSERANREQKKFEMPVLKNKLMVSALPINYENLIQIFLDNTFKYTKKNESISAHIWQKKQKIILEFSNTGAAIPASQQEKIFDRFYRGEADRNSQGFGLGLSLAKESIEAINGNIQVMSAEKNPTKFTIEIPR